MIQKDETMEDMFSAYVNNMMMVFLWLVQRKASSSREVKTRKAIFFFEDLYRHMLTYKQREMMGSDVRWLADFFKRFPGVESAEEDRAIQIMRKLSIFYSHRRVA